MRKPLPVEISEFEDVKRIFGNIERLLKESSFPGSQAAAVAECIGLARHQQEALKNKIKELKSGENPSVPSDLPVTEVKDV